MTNRRQKILVTGGAGYVGSHTTLALLQAGADVVVLDNLHNSSTESLRRVARISGREPVFVQGDIRDRTILEFIFAKHSINAVLHFAGLKAVSESARDPLNYYDNNVHGSQLLLQVMAQANVFCFVFSSSAAVYGPAAQMPISETCLVGQLTNPYGRSKLMVEDILQDLVIADQRWQIAILRYFNPVGAHESGLIGEDPKGIPNNLMPSICQVAAGKLPHLTIFGNDYSTSDGTGVRDYLHVVDLAEGHLCALEAIRSKSGSHVWNLGTGKGYSVFEMISVFESISKRKVPYSILPRRIGDSSHCYADCSKAEREIGWKASRGLSEMMRDAWRWQDMNPNGYADTIQI